MSWQMIKGFDTNRHANLDMIRGLTIIAMMLFHICFDLDYFNLIEIDFTNDYFWRFARWVIVSSFVFIMGYTLVLKHGKKIQWKSIKKRFVQLFSLSLLISIATFFLFPQTWIYFGVLHFMSLSMFIGLIFVKRPKLSLFLGLLLWYTYANDYIPMYDFYNWLSATTGLPRQSEDRVFFVPWLAPMFIGIFAGYYKLLPKMRSRKSFTFIYFLGRNALAVYMIHQPIFFAAIYILSSLI